MNNSNNSKILECNIVESDITNTEIIVDVINKINSIDKRTKKNRKGKLVVNNNINKTGKVFILGDSNVKHVQG